MSRSVPAGTSASNVPNRASVVPAGTVTVYFAVWAEAVGLPVGKPEPLGLVSVLVRLVAGTRPATDVVSVPAIPDFTGIFAVPVVPVPATSSGERTPTG